MRSLVAIVQASKENKNTWEKNIMWNRLVNRAGSGLRTYRVLSPFPCNQLHFSCAYFDISETWINFLIGHWNCFFFRQRTDRTGKERIFCRRPPGARCALIPCSGFLSFIYSHTPISSLVSFTLILGRKYTHTRTHTHIHSILFCRLSLTRTQLKCPANYRFVNKLDIFVEAT